MLRIGLDWFGLVSLDAASKGNSRGGNGPRRCPDWNENELSSLSFYVWNRPAPPSGLVSSARRTQLARRHPARPLTPAAKLILISKNCPPLRKSELEYYAML